MRLYLKKNKFAKTYSNTYNQIIIKLNEYKRSSRVPVEKMPEELINQIESRKKVDLYEYIKTSFDISFIKELIKK